MATAYAAITNAEIDPDSPVTTALMTKLRDNPIASHRMKYKTALTSRSSTTILADPHLTMTVYGGLTYIFRFAGSCNLNPDIKVRITTPDPVNDVGYMIGSYGVGYDGGGATQFAPSEYSTALIANAINAVYTFLDGGGGNSGEVWFCIDGFVKTDAGTASGTLSFDWAPNTAASLTLEAGCILSAYRADGET